MKEFTRITLPLYLISIGVAVIALQNAGVIPPHEQQKVVVTDIGAAVEVRGNVDVDNTVDVNLSQVVGHDLVESKNGMYIGVNSTQNTVIPINWGEVSIAR